MAEVALAVPPEVEGRLVDELIRHGHTVVARCDTSAELAAVLAGCGCDVAIVAASTRYLGSALLAESDAAGVRVIGLVATDEERRHAASVGLLETLDESSGWADLEAVISGTSLVDDVSPQPHRGRVIAVWGPAGSPGRTTLAISIASEIAAAGHSVVLADADTHGAAVAPALGLLDESPGFAAACRLAAAGSLDSHELERIGQRYLSGHGSFWVLTGIGRARRWPELSAERVSTTISACRDWVDYTVLDTASSLENDEEISSDLFAPRRNAAAVSALREADHVVAVGGADPIGLARFLRAHADLLETISTDQVSIVMNRVRASATGLDPGGQVTQALRRFGGIPSPIIVPNDPAVCDAAILTGRTLRDTAVRSPARMAIGQFVSSEILPPTGAGQTGRRALRRRSAAD